jgi:hypothetical protein
VQHCPGKEILLVELAPRFNNNNKNNTILSLIKMKIKHQIIGECATKPFFDLKKLTIITGS